MFWFKKIVSPFLLPLTLCLAMQILGLVLLWLTRRQKAGKALTTAGTILLFFLGYEGLSNNLLKTLEYKYPPLAVDEASTNGVGPSLASIRRIVVLGGGDSYDPRIPVTSRLSPSSVVRLVEALRLHRKIPGSKILLTGGAVHDPVSEAEEMQHLAMDLGVGAGDILLEKESRDTEDQARLIKTMVGEEPFLLVTSASHMPRAMALFEKQGLHPVAAPTDHTVKGGCGMSPDIFFPGVEGLDKATRTFHEYLGLAWAKLLGRI